VGVYLQSQYDLNARIRTSVRWTTNGKLCIFIQKLFASSLIIHRLNVGGETGDDAWFDRYRTLFCDDLRTRFSEYPEAKEGDYWHPEEPTTEFPGLADKMWFFRLVKGSAEVKEGLTQIFEYLNAHAKCPHASSLEVEQKVSEGAPMATLVRVPAAVKPFQARLDRILAFGVFTLVAFLWFLRARKHTQKDEVYRALKNVSEQEI